MVEVGACGEGQLAAICRNACCARPRSLDLILKAAGGHRRVPAESGDGSGTWVLGVVSAPVSPQKMAQGSCKGVPKRESADQRFPDFHVPVRHQRVLLK